MNVSITVKSFGEGIDAQYPLVFEGLHRIRRMSWGYRAKNRALAFVCPWAGSCLIAHDTVKFLVPEPVPGYLMKRSV